MQEIKDMSKCKCNCNKSSSCSCCCLALERRCDKSAWSMSSLVTALPQSPSLVCTHPHSHSHSLATTRFSTPRNQSQRVKSKSCSSTTCFSDIDEWLEHANKFCKPLDIIIQNNNNHLEITEEEWRVSAVSSSFITAREFNITLPSVREESPAAFQGQNSNTSCCSFTCTCMKMRPSIFNSIGGGGASKNCGSKCNNNECSTLISKARGGREPYDEFLDEVRRKKQEAQRGARNKAKHLQLLERMRRKENAIDDWELHQTRQAINKMDKIQNKLERKQVLASTRTHQKIYFVREKAEKLKLNLRRATTKKCQSVSTI